MIFLKRFISKRFRAILALPLAVVLLLFTACGCSSSEPKEVTPASKINCTVTISKDGSSYKAKLSAPGGGIFTLEVLEPTTIKGLKYSFNGEKSTVSYMGLNFDLETGGIELGVVNALKDAFFKLQSGTAEVKKNGEELTVTDPDFSLVLTARGTPLKFSALGATVSFSDVEIII